MPFGLQPYHLILIAIIAYLVFGPTRLSNFGRRLGKTIMDYLKGPGETTGVRRDAVDNVCTFCGTTNPPLSRYCSKCGISLSK
jgi:TatA/E family protein of Tat protein translocase